MSCPLTDLSFSRHALNQLPVISSLDYMPRDVYIKALLFPEPLPAHTKARAYDRLLALDIRKCSAQARFGTGTGGIVAMGIPMIAMFFCGGSSVTSNLRMLWSFSRDGALPGYKLWSSVNPWTKTPVNAVLFMVTLAFILGLPMLSSTIAFQAVVSISVIGLYISCEPSLAFVPLLCLPSPLHLQARGHAVSKCSSDGNILPAASQIIT